MTTITIPQLENLIADVEFQQKKSMTLCVLTLACGLTVIGQTDVLDPQDRNNPALKKFIEDAAYDDALKQLSRLENYHRKRQLRATAVADQLRIEWTDLAGKNSRLAAFLIDPPEGVPEEHLELLQEQHRAMSEYASILQKRLQLLEPSE